MRGLTRERVWFWFLVVSAVAGILVSVLMPRARFRARGHESVRILNPLFAADPRFRDIHASIVAADGRVFVSGEVATDSDLIALKGLIEDAHPPRKPGMNVRALSHPE